MGMYIQVYWFLGKHVACVASKVNVFKRPSYSTFSIIKIILLYAHVKMSSFSGGRPRDSCVLRYFKYVESDQKSIRIVVKSDGTECGQTFNGKFTTNLKRHLKKCHAMECSVFEKADLKRKDGQKE